MHRLWQICCNSGKTQVIGINSKTYKKWRSETIGNGYDVDGAYGFQCYDYANLFWLNACGRPFSSHDFNEPRRIISVANKCSFMSSFDVFDQNSIIFDKSLFLPTNSN